LRVAEERRMRIKVTETHVYYVETTEYTVKQLRDDEKDYGCLGIDLARNEGQHETTTITYSEVKQ
jgi:hypothetical protein